MLTSGSGDGQPRGGPPLELRELVVIYLWTEPVLHPGVQASVWEVAQLLPVLYQLLCVCKNKLVKIIISLNPLHGAGRGLALYQPTVLYF